LFHEDGISVFPIKIRRPPAHLLGSLHGKPMFHILFDKEPGVANSIVVKYLPEAERGSTPTPGKLFRLKSSAGGMGHTAPIRARIAAQLAQAKVPLETERTWLAQEMKKQSAIWAGRKKNWQEVLLTEIKHRLGPFLGVGACAGLSGKAAEAAAP